MRVASFHALKKASTKENIWENCTSSWLNQMPSHHTYFNVFRDSCLMCVRLIPKSLLFLNFSFILTDLNFSHFLILLQVPTPHELDHVNKGDLISTSNG